MFVVKLACFVPLFAPGWDVPVPAGVRVEGWLSYARPLLLAPASSELFGDEARWCAALYTGLLLVGLVLGVHRGFRTWVAADSPADTPRPVRLFLGLLVAAALCITVTGGIPARADLGDGRFWLLPSAFFVGALAALARPFQLALACLPGLALLHMNLAPWREAWRLMDGTLERLAVEVPAHGNAVRVTELPWMHGPARLFADMPPYYHLRFDTEAPEDRPYLSLTTDRPAEVKRDAAFDRRWRAWMEAGRRPVLDLAWDPGEGRLRPAAEPR